MCMSVSVYAHVHLCVGETAIKIVWLRTLDGYWHDEIEFSYCCDIL